MARPSSRQWIDAALSCTSGPHGLPYTDPNQKWIIRDHLITLLHDFPSLTPSIDTYNQNDAGLPITLLKANGKILISPSPILLTIWLHENYPIIAPSVYISSTSSFPLYPNHPFVESSGSTTSSYLLDWQTGRSNLTELVRNLIKLFSFHHPFCYSGPSRVTHPSLVTKREAIDRLACMLYYDMIDEESKTGDEIEDLSVLQAEMIKHADVATSMVLGVEYEYKNLKELVKKLDVDADVLVNWLKVYDKNCAVGMVVGDDNIDEAFEAEDEKSKVMLNYVAEDSAMEDLFYALDLAVERGVLDFETYIKQVRVLARTQFLYRYKQIGPEMS